MINHKCIILYIVIFIFNYHVNNIKITFFGENICQGIGYFKIKICLSLVALIAILIIAPSLRFDSLNGENHTFCRKFYRENPIKSTMFFRFFCQLW